MKRILVCLSLLILLSGCGDDHMKTKVCRYSNDETSSNVEVTVYHVDSEVPKLVVEMSQVFDEEIVRGVGKEKMKMNIYNSMRATAGEEAQIEVDYDEKKRKVDIKYVLFTKDLNEQQIEEYGLHNPNQLNAIVSRFESLGYTCKDGQR